MFRFIHSSDLHLGKRFGNFSDDLRGRLREARHGIIERLATHARDNGANVILLAGDTFDTETPASEIRRQAFAEMKHHSSLRWVLLPGNHDSLQAAQLWSVLKAEAPDNIVFATEAEVMTIESGVTLLGAPCTSRRPGRDLTEWMDNAATSEGSIRLGLAHGAIQSFSEDEVASDVISPDRAKRAGLDYLALGDWHGAVSVNERTYYSGTPEPDRFKHDKPGQALLVSVAGQGALPEVRSLETGSFLWRDIPIHLLSTEDATRTLETLFPTEPKRRQILLRIIASGRTSIAGRTALASTLEHVAPEFAYLELEDGTLETECENDDLDRIDRAGALREAAEALLAESSDEKRSLAERDTARAALIRLFSYCEKIAS
jgi:DNA repair exonuclease SbcCD nuclease subunit